MKRTHFSRLKLALALAAMPLAQAATAADFSWTGAVNIDFDDPGNWLEDGAATTNLPGAADNIVNPTVFSTIGVNVSSVSITDWTYNSASSQTYASTFGTAVPFTISGTMTKAGNGSVTFRRSGSTLGYDFSAAALEMSGGTLNLGNGGDPSTFSFGSVNMTGGTLNFVTGVTVGEITGSLTMGGTSLLNIVNQGFGGNVADNSLEVGSLSSASTTAIIQTNGNSAGNADDTGTLVLNNAAGTSTYAGILQPGSSAGNTNVLNIEKNGAGTQVFSGNSNTYNGTTAVNEGTLLVSNTLGSGTGTSAVTVADGATFGGTGSASGAVTVEGNGTLLGGDGSAAADSLSLSGDVTFEDMAIISLALGTSGTSSSLERLGGTWSFDADQAFTFLDLGAEVGTYEDIITGLTGAESGLGSIGSWTVQNTGWAGTFSFDGTNVDFTLTSTAIPEPATGALALLAGAGLLLRRRRK